MTGEIEEQVFEIGLPNPYLIEVTHPAGELLEAPCDVLRDDLDDALFGVHDVLDASEIRGQVLDGR